MNGSQTGSARGWSVWMASAQGIQLSAAWAWRAWCDGEASDGGAHSKAEAAEAAQAALEQMAAGRGALRESGKAAP